MELRVFIQLSVGRGIDQVFKDADAVMETAGDRVGWDGSGYGFGLRDADGEVAEGVDVEKLLEDLKSAAESRGYKVVSMADEPTEDIDYMILYTNEGEEEYE